jgi:hypothetical protein
VGTFHHVLVAKSRAMNTASAEQKQNNRQHKTSPSP